MLEVIKYYVHKNGRKVDYLVCEGTMMGVRQNEHVKTEYEVYKEAKDLFRDNKYVFLVVSSTNFDSIVSFYRAARDNKMYTYCYSRYLYKQLRTFSRAAGKKSPRYKFKDVYTVNFQKQLSHELWDENKTQEEVMRDHGFLCIIKAEEKYSEWIERFKDKNPMVIYSMWDGYLQEKRQGEKNLAYNKEWAKFFQPYERKGQLKKIHTSGHATGKMLADVINAVNPKKGIYPMHTENADGFRALEIGEELKALIKVAG